MMSIMCILYDPCTEFDRLFDEVFGACFWPSNTIERCCDSGSIQHPERVSEGTDLFRMDLHENTGTKTVTVTFDLPLKLEDVAVEVQQDRLMLSGDSRDLDWGGYAVRESPRGKFSRTVR
ncbi:hypothetical protein K503DRAFT_723288, partial [Rhizopogon vinicolor AM-OR11-026]